MPSARLGGIFAASEIAAFESGRDSFNFRVTIGNHECVAREVAFFAVNFEMKTLLKKAPHHELELCLRRIAGHCRVEFTAVWSHVVHNPGRTNNLVELDIPSGKGAFFTIGSPDIPFL